MNSSVVLIVVILLLPMCLSGFAYRGKAAFIFQCRRQPPDSSRKRALCLLSPLLRLGAETCMSVWGFLEGVQIKAAKKPSKSNNPHMAGSLTRAE